MILKGERRKINAYVDETNLGGLLTEAASAKEEVILSNETTAVTTGTATALNRTHQNKYQAREPGPYSRG